MGHEALPFVSDDIARAKKKRETVRIFILASVMCVFLSMTSKHPAQAIPRMVMLDAIPYGLLILFVRRVVPNVRFKSFGRAVIFQRVDGLRSP